MNPRNNNAISFIKQKNSQSGNKKWFHIYSCNYSMSAYTYAAFEFGAYQMKVNGKTTGGALQTGTLLSLEDELF